MTTLFKTATDFRKSLEERLKRLAIKNNQDLQRMRRKVAFERLLARIFHQDKEDNFVLKGGYAMELRFASSRATKDIDLTCLHRANHSQTSIEQIVNQELQRFAKLDLNDFFTFEIGTAKMDLDNAPYGGARYSVASFIDKRLFVRFQLDVGADVVVDSIEHVHGVDWLEYCGIPTPLMRMISIEQQLAEKLHAYSLPREQRLNSRVKDLIDMLLLIRSKSIDPVIFKEILQKIYQVRATHSIPTVVAPPPHEWAPLFQTLAVECKLDMTMSQVHSELDHFFRTHF